MSGPYGRAAYVGSLSPEGSEVVPLWGGHVLLRPLPGAVGVDAAGAYPLAGFDPGADLRAGLQALASRGAVALAAVPDPLYGPDEAELRRQADVYRRLKTHYLLDRDAGPFAPTRHHRQEIRRADRRCTVEAVGLGAVMPDWLDLYARLSDRRGIGPAARLPEAHFEWLARDPQAVTLVARVDGSAAAISIWLSDGEVAHNHLGASSNAGYRVGASYALYAAAIDRFAGHRALDFGGMPGLVDDPAHGLARFKRGFANAERSTVLAGFVLDRARYDRAVAQAAEGQVAEGQVAEGEAAEAQAAPVADFFPAYRAPGRRTG